MSEEKITTLLSTNQVPIIDLANCDISLPPSTAVVQQLHAALASKGLAFLINHGISSEKMKSSWCYFDQFCALPNDVKETYKRTDNDNHGYIKPNQELLGGSKSEIRHTFNIMDCNRLPDDLLPGFRDQVFALIKDFLSLSSFVLKALAIGLNLEIDYFDERHLQMMSGTYENLTTFRLLYYPAISMDLDTTAGSGLTRCGAHCDYGTFTLLSQDSEGGLEVRLPGRENWYRVGHLPGGIFLNAGEMLSLWTEGRCLALLHRVIVPEEEVTRDRERHSMAFFVQPDDCTVIKPLIPLPAGKVVEPVGQWPTAQQLIEARFLQSYGHNTNNLTS